MAHVFPSVIHLPPMTSFRCSFGVQIPLRSVDPGAVHHKSLSPLFLKWGKGVSLLADEAGGSLMAAPARLLASRCEPQEAKPLWESH